MKQDSPLRKEDRYHSLDFRIMQARLSKPTPAQIDARRRLTDKCDCDDASQCWEQCGELGHSEEHAVEAPKEPNLIREAAQGLVGGIGLAAALVAVVALFVDNPEMFGVAALGLVVCMLGYLYLDDE